MKTCSVCGKLRMITYSKYDICKSCLFDIFEKKTKTSVSSVRSIEYNIFEVFTKDIINNLSEEQFINLV